MRACRQDPPIPARHPNPPLTLGAGFARNPRKEDLSQSPLSPQRHSWLAWPRRFKTLLACRRRGIEYKETLGELCDLGARFF